MADRVHPSAKPVSNGTAPNTTTANGNATATAAPIPAKPQIYRPYRPNSAARRRRHVRRCKCTTCCCCFWTILLILCLSLLAAIAGAALYVLYRPHSPSFSLTSLRTTALNLTTSSDASVSHLTTSFNVILTSKNPNSHFTFDYDPFTVTFITPTSSVFLGNGTVAAFSSGPKNFTTLRAVVSVSSMDLDTESASSLRSDMKKRNGVPVRVLLDTRVTVTTGKLKSKRVGIRVSCEGIKGISTPVAKGGTLANIGDSKCKVDLRIKIWRFTF